MEQQSGSESKLARTKRNREKKKKYHAKIGKELSKLPIASDKQTKLEATLAERKQRRADSLRRRATELQNTLKWEEQEEEKRWCESRVDQWQLHSKISKTAANRHSARATLSKEICDAQERYAEFVDATTDSHKYC